MRLIPALLCYLSLQVLTAGAVLSPENLTPWLVGAGALFVAGVVWAWRIRLFS